MQVSAIIPTFRRPDDLRKCLDGLQAQSRLPDEVVIVVRDIDEETDGLLEAYVPGRLTIKQVVIGEGGQVAALNCALDAASGDILAITDDDTVPNPNWIGLIHARFEADPKLGGIGGPDWIATGGRVVDGSIGVCGKMQWFGRLDCSECLSAQVCEVDTLKGCNMSYRRTAIEGVRFDESLAGEGAQVLNDHAFALAVRRRGWKLIYDREIAVDHFPGAKFDQDKRFSFVSGAHANYVHNNTLLVLKHLPLKSRFVFILYALLIGSKPMPGLAELPLRILRKENNPVRFWWSTMIGRARGIATFLKVH
jgi:glycosyltransferase involved in cell wall biosynthesis